MTWKRTFFAAAILTNVVVFVLPGGVFFYLAIDSLAPTGPPLSMGDPLMFASIGFILLVFGVFNLACLYSACKSRGLNQSSGIGLGVVSCVLMAIATVVLLISSATFFRGSELLFPSIMLGSVTLTTARALWLHRSGLIPDWQCPKCDYDLRGLDDGVCPECGLSKAEREAFAAD